MIPHSKLCKSYNTRILDYINPSYPLNGFWNVIYYALLDLFLMTQYTFQERVNYACGKAIVVYCIVNVYWPSYLKFHKPSIWGKIIKLSIHNWKCWCMVKSVPQLGNEWMNEPTSWMILLIPGNVTRNSRRHRLPRFESGEADLEPTDLRRELHSRRSILSGGDAIPLLRLQRRLLAQLWKPFLFGTDRRRRGRFGGLLIFAKHHLCFVFLDSSFFPEHTQYFETKRNIAFNFFNCRKVPKSY